MSHTCEALIIHCIDFRLHPQLASELPQMLGIKSFDLAGAAGAAKNLLTDGPARDFALSQIEISSELHQIGKVVLVNHTDCGAYGGSFPCEDDKHIEDMRRAAEVIGERFPRLEVIKVLTKLIEREGGWVAEFKHVD